MPYYLAEIRFNKNKSKKSGKKEKKRKRLIPSLVGLTLISLLISVPILLFSVIVIASEPSLPSILNDLGFTNIALTDVETFSPGTYNITLYAEFTCCHDQNELSYYAVRTCDFQTIFTGPEGGNGYVTPSLSKSFESDSQFGLSMLSPRLCRYFTEHCRNPDSPEQHAMVYRNLDAPGMFLLGFESVLGGGDIDYDDMVFSIVPIVPVGHLEIVSVMRSPETPNYDQPVKIAAQVISEVADIESVILGYQINSASWINVTMNLECGLYVADILAQPYNTAVNYKVYASDTAGRSVVSELFSYVVGDFVPPVISNILQVPNSPYPYEIVKVSATVTEPAEASGVKNVTIWYTTTGIWSFTDMAMQDGLWTANIPGHSAGAYVKFFVEAFDNAENNAKTSNFGYTVIIPNMPPVAEFSESATIVYTGVSINFNASDSYDLDGYIASYSWDFGDGNTGSGVTVNHAYVDDGEYTVTLTVADNMGATDSKTAVKLVKNRPPIASVMGYVVACDKEEIVTFDASLSYDLDGTIVDYSWDFGDGSTATGVKVSTSYTESGAYTITLTVTDDDGATGTIATSKTVRNKSPVANFTESAENVYVDERISFDAAESHDPDGTIVAYSWDFGDGSTATGVTVSHAYSDNGLYLVTLTVTDNDGATASAHATKTVMNRPPVASFTETAESVNTDEPITFDASDSSDPDGSIVAYSWDFGDGATGTGVSVQHAYSQDGTYIVTLTVTDDDGATDTISATKTVLNRSPIASFTKSAETVSSGESIHFDASGSHDPDGTIVSYSWDFGDGNTATGVEVDHAYEDDGVYTVTLTVIDDGDATGSATATKNVLNRSPIASFTENATIVKKDEAIHFDASESHDPDGAIVSYSWDFGDGNTATGVTSDHAYSEDGNYTVTLTVTDDDGASASLVAAKIVETEIEIETALPLAVLSVIGLGVTSLTATLLYGLFIRRKKKKKKKTEENT
jgi:PKD repeat protein